MKLLKYLLIINIALFFSCEVNPINDNHNKPNTEDLIEDMFVQKSVQIIDSVISEKPNTKPVNVIEENYKPHPGKQRSRVYDSAEMKKMIEDDTTIRKTKDL